MNLSTFDNFKRRHFDGAVELSTDDVSALQKTLVMILQDMAEVGVEVGVDWMLAGGSALGAIRHGGFIPWDDDLDVLMTHEHWNVFKIAFTRRFGNKYQVCEVGRPAGYPLAFPRIRLRGTRVVTREDLFVSNVEPGVFVDVFLLENVPNNFLLRRLHGLGSLGFGFLYSCRKHFSERQLLRRWGMNDVACRVKRMIGFFLAVLPLAFWTRLWDRWNRCCGNMSSNMVSCPVGRKHYFGELAPRAEMKGTRELEFEGRLARVPVGLESYLTRLYGPDYMTPPPPEKRERHVVFEPLVLKENAK